MTHDQLISHEPIVSQLRSLGWTCEDRTFQSRDTSSGKPFSSYSWEMLPPNALSEWDWLEFTEPFILDDVWREYAEVLVDEMHGKVLSEAFERSAKSTMDVLVGFYARKLAGDETVVIPAEITVPAMTIRLVENPAE